jgi:hypothetical protein
MGGAFAVPGYAMKGIYQEMIKNKGKTVQNYIVAARIAQGYNETNDLSARERADIISKWNVIKVGIKKKKNIGADQMDSLHLLVQEKRQRRQDRWARVNFPFKRPEAQPSFPPAMNNHNGYQESPLTHTMSNSSAATASSPRTLPPGEQPAWRQQHAATFPVASNAQSQESQISLESQLIAEEAAEQRELEAAIAASISHHSSGDPDEDRLVANAIRASIAELDRTPADAGIEEEEQALKRAMQASLDEAGRNGSSEEEQRLLEETIRQSLLETSRRRQHGSDSEWDSGSSEDDEELRRVVEASKEVAEQQQQQQRAGVETGDDEEEELKKAMEMSQQTHREDVDRKEKERTEEEVVLEYVRKQSLLEEEHRRRVMDGRDTFGEASGSASTK